VIYVYYVGQTDVIEKNMITVYGFISGTGTLNFGTNNLITIPYIRSCKIIDVK
jgi:hypothetical protein